MIIKDSIRFIIASIAMVLFVLFGCGTRTAYANSASDTVPEISKTIEAVEVKGEEDAYELSLSINPKNVTLTEAEPLDVIFVIDLSDSMNKELDDNGTRLEHLKNALAKDGGLIDSILSSSANRLSLVTFAGKNAKEYGFNKPNHSEETYQDATILSNWDSGASVESLKTAVEKLETDKTSEQTNIAAGLLKANDLLSNARDKAKKVIVLLTDGKANHYYDSSGHSTYGSENNSSLLKSLTGAAETLNKSSLDALYSISFVTTDAQAHLQKVHDTLDNKTIENKIFQADDEEKLLDCLREISKNVTNLMFTKVVITDALSEWVELLDGETSDIRLVKVENNDEKNETVLDDTDVKITTTTNESGKVTVTATFAENYWFTEGYSYILKFKVRLTQAAYDEFADGETKPSRLPSNAEVTLNYYYGDEKQDELTFETPYIDSVTLKIPITVEWDMLDGQEVSETSVKVELFQDGGENSYRKEDVTGDKWTSSFTSVAKGKHTYTVEAPDITGFTKMVENVGTDAKPEFVVTYRQNPTLTIKKVLEGLDGEDSSKTFNIEVEASDGEGNPLHATYGKTIFVNGKATVEVKANGEVKIPYLPRGTSYTVKESDASSEGYTVSYDKEKGTLDKENVVVTVTNTKLPSLTISKTVTGDYGDKQKDFTFNITLSDENGFISGEFQAEKGDEATTVTFTDGKASVELKHGESITITDLPFKANYEVSEDTTKLNNNYTVTYNGEQKDSVTGTLSKNITIDVVNTMTEITSTGGNSSHGSAVKLGVIGGLAVLVALALVARKVRKDDL